VATPRQAAGNLDKATLDELNRLLTETVSTAPTAPGAPVPTPNPQPQN